MQMILHSIVPVEAMQQMLADQQTVMRRTEPLSDTHFIESYLQNGEWTIERIISTNLQDYLNPALTPGTHINTKKS